MGNICFTKKYITFYKNTYESLEKQLECYISDEFNCDGNICGHNIIGDDFYIYYFQDNNKNIHIKIKCKILHNKLNYKMTLLEIHNIEKHEIIKI
jgi:hypothetical protein